MTRIVAGTAGGRRLRVPPAGTRPTSDRVREALFSALDARIDFDGVRVLDLYAGRARSAWKRCRAGAVHALLIESDRAAAAIVRGNIADLGLPGAEVRMGTVASVLERSGAGEFDVVFSDPPYDVDTAAVTAESAGLEAARLARAGRHRGDGALHSLARDRLARRLCRGQAA